MDKNKVRKEIEEVLNRNSAENESDTPDFVLAHYLMDCLEVFDRTTNRRTRWYSPVEAKEESIETDKVCNENVIVDVQPRFIDPSKTLYSKGE